MDELGRAALKLGGILTREFRLKRRSRSMSPHKYIPEEMYVQILEQLEQIEEDHDVKILFAIESGSRAWGFPSPDSDYDVRFVYTHQRDWYLSIHPGRDVIELPIVGDLDINGWDLKKALQLLIKPNPVLLEWMCSPIQYRVDEENFAQLRNLAADVNHVRTSSHHYLHLASSQYRRFIDGKNDVAMKKYFYVIRPVMALMWLRARPNDPVPMDLPTLTSGIDLPTDVSNILDEMLEQKLKSKELGSGPRLALLDDFVSEEIEKTRAVLEHPGPMPDRILDTANGVFREIVDHVSK